MTTRPTGVDWLLRLLVDLVRLVSQVRSPVVMAPGQFSSTPFRVTGSESWLMFTLVGRLTPLSKAVSADLSRDLAASKVAMVSKVACSVSPAVLPKGDKDSKQRCRLVRRRKDQKYKVISSRKM